MGRSDRAIVPCRPADARCERARRTASSTGSAPHVGGRPARRNDEGTKSLPPQIRKDSRNSECLRSDTHEYSRTRRSPIFAIRCVRCAAETTASRHSPSRYTRLLVNARDARAAVTARAKSPAAMAAVTSAGRSARKACSAARARPAVQRRERAAWDKGRVAWDKGPCSTQQCRVQHAGCNM